MDVLRRVSSPRAQDQTTLIVALALTTFHAGAFAQSTVVIEACNAIADSQKRLECLKEALKLGNTPPTVTATDKLRDHLTAFKGAIEAGVSYQQYQGLTLDLSKEVALFKASVANADARALLDDALQAYSEAGQFWIASIRYASRQRNMFIASNVLPAIDMQIAGLAHLPSRYSIPLSKTDAFGLGAGVDRGAGLRAIWVYAGQRADEAIALALGRRPATAGSADEAVKPSEDTSPEPPPN